MLVGAIADSFAIIKNKSAFWARFTFTRRPLPPLRRNGTVDVFINLNALFGRERGGVSSCRRAGVAVMEAPPFRRA